MVPGDGQTGVVGLSPFNNDDPVQMIVLVGVPSDDLEAVRLRKPGVLAPMRDAAKADADRRFHEEHPGMTVEHVD